MVEQIAHFLGKLYRTRENFRRGALYFIASVILYNLHDVLVDLTFSFLHTTLEWFEYALEELIEHLFHTTRQQTQAIVFYLLLSLGIYGCYRLVLSLKGLCRRWRLKASVEWGTLQTQISYFWRHRSTLEKLKLVFSGSASIVVLAVLAFS